MSPPAPHNQIRYEALDGIRGYAALIVIVYHCLLALDPQIWHKFDKLSILDVQNLNEFLSKIALTLFNGDAAVVIFFILSGFVLGQSLLRDLSRYEALSAIGAFLIRRFLRLYPALLAALVGTVAIIAASFWLFSVPFSGFYFGPMNFVRNALLISPEISGITWSILIEFAAIPYIIIACYFIYKSGYIIAILFVFVALIARDNKIITLHFLKFHLYILCFALGVLMCTSIGDRIARGVGSINKTLIFGAFLGVSLFWSNSAVQIVLGYLWLSSFLHAQDGWTTALSSRISLYFGRISYGLYLWHYPFAVSIYTPFAIFYPEALSDRAIWFGLLTAPLIIPVTIVLAHFSERFLERPFIALGYQLSQGLQRPQSQPLSR